MSSSARASDAHAAGGYRRPPHMRGFGLAATLLALAAGTSVAMVATMSPVRPLRHAPALSLFEIAPSEAAKQPETRAPAQPAAAHAPASRAAPAVRHAVAAAAPATPGPLPPSPAQAKPTEPLASPPAQPAFAPLAAPMPTPAAHPEYAARLWSHIASFRPRGMRLPGTTLVGFTVRASGALEEVHVARSSGNAMLDALALRTVRRASPAPPPPADAGTAAQAFVIPFTFD